MITLPASSRSFALPPRGGDPPKTERPESLHPDGPINHHVTDHQVADPDKPGHPRSRAAPHRTQPLPAPPP